MKTYYKYCIAYNCHLIQCTFNSISHAIPFDSILCSILILIMKIINY